jgi:hypothetical protein
MSTYQTVASQARQASDAVGIVDMSRKPCGRLRLLSMVLLLLLLLLLVVRVHGGGSQKGR